MIGYLKLPYANPKKGAKRSIIHHCIGSFIIYWHHYFEYCRNVVLGRKTAKVHHYMLHCFQFIMWSGASTIICYIAFNLLCRVEKQMEYSLILSITKKEKKRRETSLNCLIHRLCSSPNIIYFV